MSDSTSDDLGSSERPLEISWDDLSSDAVDARVEQMRSARQVPLVRPVGDPGAEAPAGPWAWLHGSVASLALAGFVGALLTWGLSETVLQGDAEDPWYGDSVTTGNVLYTLAFALGIGLVVAAWDGVVARSWAKAGSALAKAAPVVLGIGLVAGFLTDKVYTSMTEALYEDAYAEALREGAGYLESLQIMEDYVSSHIHLPRGIAFAMVGVAVGAALGAASRSGKRALNGAIGGFVGGFVGGYLFDYVGPDDGSGVLPRLVATVITGVLVGVAMGLVETVRREHWLEIVSGGMAGKQFILYHQETVVGSGADCHVTLIKDPRIAPRQLALVRNPAGLAVRSLDSTHPALVNGRPVTEQGLNDGDLLQLGTTVLRYRAKAEDEPLPGPIHG